MKLFDSHCHLTDIRIFPDIEKILQRAAAANVAGLALCGTNPVDWAYCASSQKKFQGLENVPEIFPMLGIHPWFVSKDWKKSFQLLEKTLRKHPDFGIGETGLDFLDKHQNRAEQELCFAAHLNLARKLKRPIAVHCVKAWEPLLRVIKQHPAQKIILHAFAGAPELVPEFVELNCWFSFCGSVTNSHSKKIRASAAAVPAERLLIETDAPDFTPVGVDSPNEPANLIRIAAALAEVRAVSVEEIANRTSKNFNALFSRG